MPQPNEKACRGNGRRCDVSAGLRRCDSTRNPPGWICVRGDTDALPTCRRQRSALWFVRASGIVGLRHVDGTHGPRTIIHVRHRGAEVRVSADEPLQDVLQRLALVQAGGTP